MSRKLIFNTLHVFCIIMLITICATATPIQQLSTQLRIPSIKDPIPFDFEARPTVFWNMGEFSTDFNITSRLPDAGYDWNISIQLAGIDLIDDAAFPHLLTATTLDSAYFHRDPHITYYEIGTANLINFAISMSRDGPDILSNGIEIMLRNKHIDMDNFAIRINATLLSTGQMWYSPIMQFKTPLRLAESANMQLVPASDGPVARDFIFELNKSAIYLNRRSQLTANSSKRSSTPFFRSRNGSTEHICSWGPTIAEQVKVIISSSGHELDWVFHNADVVRPDTAQVIEIGQSVAIRCPLIWLDFSSFNGRAPTFQFYPIATDLSRDKGASITWQIPSY